MVNRSTRLISGKMSYPSDTIMAKESYWLKPQDIAHAEFNTKCDICQKNMFDAGIPAEPCYKCGRKDYCMRCSCGTFNALCIYVRYCSNCVRPDVLYKKITY